MARDERPPTAPLRPALLAGLVAATAALVAWGVWLAGGEGNALKALVAVWLAALPVLGMGALAGWLVASAVLVFRRRPEPAGHTAPHDRMATPEPGEDAGRSKEQHGRADRA
jgi:hypothetical protein